MRAVVSGMPYRDSAQTVQAGSEPQAALTRARLDAANINPATGLATDYLNRFNEAIMLLELVTSCPECRDDFLAWRPMSYREHFEASNLKGRDLTIAAYEDADPTARAALDALADTMSAVLENTRVAMNCEMPPERTAVLAENAAGWLRPLIARAGAVINGTGDDGMPELPQAIVDGLMNR